MLREKVKELEQDIQAMRANHQRALVDMQEKERSNLANDGNRRAEQAREEIIATKDAEIATLKAEYEEKLEALVQKNNAAVEFVKKMKAATSHKIQMISTEKAEQTQREKEELEMQLRSEFEAKLASLSTEIAAKDQEIKSLIELHEADVQRLQDESSVAMEITRRENDTQMTALRQEHADAAERIKKQVLETSAGVEEELTQRLQAVEENYAKALLEMEADKQKELEAFKIEKEEATKSIVMEYDKALATAIAEKLEVQEKAHEELEKRLKSQSEQHTEQMENLKKAMDSHVEKVKKHFLEKIGTAEASHKSSVAELESQLRAREEQLAKMVGQMKASTTETSALREEKESIHNKLKSEAVVQQALRKKLEEMQKALSESQSSSSLAVASMSQKVGESEKEKANLQEQLKLITLERNAATNKVEELSGKLSALGSNLSAMLDEKKELDEQLQQLSKQGAKLRSTESELASLRDQVNMFKLEQTKNRSLLEKLQAEKEASEQKHGQRTALAGMLEEQLADLNEKNTAANAKLEAALYDLSSKDEVIQSMKEQLDNTVKELAEAQNASRKANESLTVAQRGADAKKAKMVEQLQREIQSLQQQMTRKSAAAQRLIQEREAECIELRKQNKFLAQEVDKGSISDRRIFELAAQQSNRESMVSAEIDIRDKVVQRLTEKLVAKDGDLASAEYKVTQIDNQVAELCRVRRREDVNLDYLKSIVVQYLSKPPGSTERGALLPVLATLLQFDEKDYKTIEEGKNKVSWWGTVTPTFIEAPSPARSTVSVPAEQLSLLGGGGSAEVTISSSINGTPKSSLEF